MIDVSCFLEFQQKLRFSSGLFNVSNKIWVFWRDGFHAFPVCNNEQFLHLALSQDSWSKVVYSYFVYAKCTQAERRHLWNGLSQIASSIGDHPWIIGRDFNVISFLEEYLGKASQDLHAIEDFNNFISTASLQQITTISSKYTWSGTRLGGRVWKCLDRILCNSSWQQLFSNSLVQHLNRCSSDYSPLLFQLFTQAATSPKSLDFRKFGYNIHHS